VSSTGVFGRERELALAEAFLDRAEGRSGVLRLDGEAGIGKTTVWREVVRRAQERGFRVLSCRPAEAETKLALSALADLLDPIGSEVFATLPQPQRRALEVALLRVEPARAGPDPRALATAVRSLFAMLGAQRPLLVAIDDVQWLDSSSAAVLDFARRRLAGARVGWLLTTRVPAPVLLGVGAIAPAESLTVVSVGPLTLAAVHRMLKDRLDEPLSRPTLLRVHEASGGNPLFALEIVRALRTGLPIAAGARLSVPAGLRELVAGRIPMLPPSARRALLAAAALSHPTAELVERASSVSGLAAAEESGLVRVEDGRTVFAHPLYASAVYERSSRARRRELHGRLAQLVSDPEERARHLALATTQADESVARTLEEGAAFARARGAWESAAELLEGARMLTPSDRSEAAWRRGIAAAEHHVHAGERARARVLLEEILDRRLPRALRADALRLLAEISYNDENGAEAMRLFTAALDYTDDPPLAVTIELGLSYLSGQLADPAGGVVHAHRALEQAQAIADESMIAAALGLCVMFDYLCGRGVNWDQVKRSLALEDPDSIMPVLWHPSTVAAILLLYVGRHAEARERLGMVWTKASDRGDESDVAFIVLWLSWLETRSGNFAAAQALAEEAVSLAALTGSESMRGTVLAQRALVHAHRGEAAEALRDCVEATALAERLVNVWVEVWVAASQALLALARGNPRAAWEACQRPTEALERQGIAEPVPAFFLPDALESLIALGELDRAGPLLDAFEARGRELDRAWALATAGRCRGLLLAARGDLAGADAALERAVVEHQRLDMPFELARTLLIRGVVERRARRRARARRSFEEALEIFERVGAALWTERARQELGRLGIRRSPARELSQAERRVAEAAARGLTNREVAAALFLSPKTVEAHLSSVYRKLELGSRAELGARMAERVQD
jgi:DNA-binding CsgD family transcriptional regulator